MPHFEDITVEYEPGTTTEDTIYFLMAEENVRKLIPFPWVSFGSDEASQAPEGVFLRSNCHPRAYGNFARLLAKYVRDEKVVPLQEAIRRLNQSHIKGEVLTGVFYINTKTPTFIDLLNMTDQPLATLPQSVTRPGREVLEQVMEELR